jgi:hypothetical protein
LKLADKAPESPVMDTPSDRLNPHLEDQSQEIKPTVMGPPGFGSPDPATASGILAPVVDHPLRATFSDDYGADVMEDSNLESMRGNVEEVDEDEMTLDELKDEAKKRDLPVSGTKAELAARINEYDEAQAELENDDQ